MLDSSYSQASDRSSRRGTLASCLLAALASAIALATTAANGWAATLSEIQQRGRLIVAVKENVRPLGFRDDRGNLQGLEIDLARRLAQQLLGDESAVTFVPVRNPERLPAVMEGRVDLAIARITATPSRSRLVDFSPYYYLDGTGIVTRSSAIAEPEDLAGKAIAVLERSSTIATIRSKIPSAQLLGVTSYQEAWESLERGEAIAFAGDNSILAGWVQAYPSYRQLSVRLSGEALCVALPRGLQYSELRLEVNAAIQEARRSGWLRQAATRWGLP